MDLVEQVRLAGVVGAGGGGFPAHVKLAAKADTVIANGAECEPLLHKDAVIMEHNAAELVRGMQLSMEKVYPKEACDDAKASMRRANIKWSGPTNVKPHAMQDGRHVPIKTLTKKLHVQDYDLPAPLRDGVSPARLVLPLKQSAGTACIAKVAAGSRVTAGQIIGEPAPNALGAVLHAPTAGTVREVSELQIILER